MTVGCGLQPFAITPNYQLMLTTANAKLCNLIKAQKNIF